MTALPKKIRFGKREVPSYIRACALPRIWGRDYVHHLVSVYEQ